MSRKRINRIVFSASALVFALAFAWLALMQPTSAWFYQSLYDEPAKNFTFGTLAFDIPQEYLFDAAIDLPAGTKLFENEIEPYPETLFDQALHIVEMKAVNTGTLPARVYLTVTPISGGTYDGGLHYFFFDAAEVTTTIRALIADKLPGDDIYTALETYNIGDGQPGGDEGNYVVVPPGEKWLKIAFWADYETVGAALESATVDEYYHYDVELILNAGQNSDGWFTR